ncbi:hypothetical protein [Mycobacterium timonense]|uniref:hypothetical protein n=1 Tax=Mycobacterium timonense TaxID=701043 RepID=UPI0035A397F5
MTSPQPLDQRLDGGRVEHIGAKLHIPAIPAGCPAEFQRSASVNVRSMRAD